MEKQRFLIVGQGLAGSIVSQKLFARNIDHTVVDDNHKYAATKAAAGIINPITGRRYVKSWMIDELLPVARSTYHEFEKLLACNLLSELNILRSLANNQEENAWHEAVSRPGYGDYVVMANWDNYKALVQERQSYGEIAEAMQVNVKELISAYRAFLKSQNLLVEAAFDSVGYDYDALVYKYNGENYSGIVFCDGYKSSIHPLFRDLPFQPAKGESFIIQTEQKVPNKILRDKIFLAPQNENEFWTGGGYQWKGLTELPTSNWKEEWQAKVDELLKVPYTIMEHNAGIRPSVKGRRPLLGQHFKYSRVYLFNGMGTKGTSLAPYWAERFLDLLLNKQAISEEVDLNRFVTN